MERVKVPGYLPASLREHPESPVMAEMHSLREGREIVSPLLGTWNPSAAPEAPEGGQATLGAPGEAQAPESLFSQAPSAPGVAKSTLGSPSALPSLPEAGDRGSLSSPELPQFVGGEGRDISGPDFEMPESTPFIDMGSLVHRGDTERHEAYWRS